MFEADRIPDSWCTGPICATTFVIVPTESSRKAWTNASYPKAKIRLYCPLAVEMPGRTAVQAPPLALRFEGRRAAWTPAASASSTSPNSVSRKNLLGLRRAWLRATASAEMTPL